MTPFEEHRGHLRAVAYRMLGSVGEADDAVQEAWLRFSRADTGGVENLRGWLTTVVARVCLDMLRSRSARREEPLDAGAAASPARAAGPDPEREAVLADSVGLALLVVLETLAPDERLAFVLHDMFDLPFDEIAPLVGRTPTAARQLASRARRRVRGTAPSRRGLAGQRTVVEAFLAAARSGDFEALVRVLDPDVVRRLHVAGGPPRVLRGAQAVAQGALAGSRGTAPLPVDFALVDGKVGLVLAPRGRLSMVMTFEIRRGRIVGIDVISDRARFAGLDLAVLPG